MKETIELYGRSHIQILAFLTVISEKLGIDRARLDEVLDDLNKTYDKEKCVVNKDDR